MSNCRKYLYILITACSSILIIWVLLWGGKQKNIRRLERKYIEYGPSDPCGRKALEQIKRVFKEKSTTELVECLRTKQYQEATIRLAVDEVVRRDGPESIGIIIDKSFPPFVRREALSYLSWVNNRKALQISRKILKNNDYAGVRGNALSVLGTYGGKEDIPIIRSFLEGKDTNFYMNAASFLKSLGAEDEVIAILTEKIKKGNPNNIRCEAIKALSQLRASSTIAIFLQILDDAKNDKDVRSDASWAIYYLTQSNLISDKSTISRIVLFLNDHDPNVQFWTIKTLANIKGRETIPVLIELKQLNSGRSVYIFR